MSLRALGRQFNKVVVQPIKRVNEALKEDDRQKLHEAPIDDRDNWVGFK